MSYLDDLAKVLRGMPPEERKAIEAAAVLKYQGVAWLPTPDGPQEMAFKCEADELFYGGQAGGGKTDLGLGLALTAHKRALILRRVNKDALKLVERVAEILGHRDGYNGQLQRWKLPGSNLGTGRMITFSGCEHEDDKQRFKGDPH